MELAFRIPCRADIDTILAFRRDLYAHDPIPFDEQAARTALEALLDDSSLGRVWLIIRGGETIGYLVLTLGYSLEFYGRDAFLDELFVRVEDRGSGVGTAAVRFAETECRALGVRALHLEVDRTNTVAQAVYRRAGFHDHDRYLMTKWIGR